MGIAPALDWARIVTIGFEVSVKQDHDQCKLDGPFSFQIDHVSVDSDGKVPLLGGSEGWHTSEWKTVTDAMQGGDSTASLTAGGGDSMASFPLGRYQMSTDRRKYAKGNSAIVAT